MTGFKFTLLLMVNKRGPRERLRLDIRLLSACPLCIIRTTEALLTVLKDLKRSGLRRYPSRSLSSGCY